MFLVFEHQHGSVKLHAALDSAESPLRKADRPKLPFLLGTTTMLPTQYYPWERLQPYLVKTRQSVTGALGWRPRIASLIAHGGVSAATAKLLTRVQYLTHSENHCYFVPLLALSCFPLRLRARKSPGCLESPCFLGHTPCGRLIIQVYTCMMLRVKLAQR